MKQADCEHDHLLVFCDQQVIVRIFKEAERRNPDSSILWKYRETVINDQASPLVRRVVCETCGSPVSDEDYLHRWTMRQDRKHWVWTLASKMEFAETIRNLRTIVKELTDGGRSK